MLEHQCKSWPGALVAAVYAPLVGGSIYSHDSSHWNGSSVEAAAAALRELHAAMQQRGGEWARGSIGGRGGGHSWILRNAAWLGTEVAALWAAAVAAQPHSIPSRTSLQRRFPPARPPPLLLPGACNLGVALYSEECGDMYSAGVYPFNAMRNRALAMATTEVGGRRGAGGRGKGWESRAAPAAPSLTPTALLVPQRVFACMGSSLSQIPSP